MGGRVWPKHVNLNWNIGQLLCEIEKIRQKIRPDIRHPAVAGYPAGYPASGIFYEKHPASGIRQLPDIRQSGRVLNEKSNYFSGFKMTFAATDYKTCKQDAQDHV